MRTAIDDLLADLDDMPEQVPPTKSVSTEASKPAGRTDIDHLLDHLNSDDEEIQIKPAPQYKPEPVVTRKRTEKCYPTVIAGAGVPDGLCHSLREAKSCNMLRCTRCDIPVKRFFNAVWSDQVNYLFFRNNYSREAELRSMLKPANGWCAYSCQCTWQQTNQVTELPSEGWVCRGHQTNS